VAATTSPIVFVHGAWHGAWCWDRVVPLLHARGVETLALDLPSVAEPARADLSDDSATLRQALDGLARPAIVVGHSYGGMVISEGAADHPMVKRLVYLTAFVPDIGESVNQLTAQLPNPDLMRAIKFGTGRSALDPAIAGEVFYNDCDADTVAWALTQLRPMRMSGAGATAAAWRTLPSTYVVCKQDRAILPELQRKMATRTGDVVEWDTSHSPFASRPELVADLCERFARG
jgi:pimeloyl-ACP methyl ester carboxylesterase